jgi:hypothetical protein
MNPVVIFPIVRGQVQKPDPIDKILRKSYLKNI